MVDIDEVVVKFCKQHLTENTEAFADPRLELIIGDARAGLENYPGKFDVAGLGGRRIGCAELRAPKVRARKLV